MATLLLLAGCGAPRQHAPGPSLGQARPTSYDPPGPPNDPWGPYIADASARFDIPQRWIREVMRQESAGRVSATSPVGAMGLMQVMPGTYAELRSRHGLGDDPYHPWDSIMAGTAYLRQMYDLYGSPAFLAAYNAGPRRLEDYLWNGRGLPNETRNYVARIGPRIVDVSPNRRVAPEIYAAAEIPLNVPAGPRRMDAGTRMALREQRSRAEPEVQLASRPVGQVVRMEPIPDGSTYATFPEPLAPAAPPVQIASLTGGPVIRMEPIVSPGDFAQAPLAGVAAETLAPIGPAAGALRAPATLAPPASLRAPPLPASALRPPAPAGRGAPVEVAAPRTAGQTRLAAAAPQPPTAPRSLGLLSTASAGTLPAGARPVAITGGSAWAVQVGAFSSEQQARDAAAAARAATGQASSRPVVMPVLQGRTTLWRARVTGLSRDAAQSTCNRLRAGCIVVNPES